MYIILGSCLPVPQKLEVVHRAIDDKIVCPYQVAILRCRPSVGVGEPAVAAGRAVVGDESTEGVEEVNLLT